MKKLIHQYEQDWLGSSPVFYNTKTLKVSKNINEVIDFCSLELHPEGFNNYLDFGYSVFEQTPIKNVKFMRYSSLLRIYDDNTLEVEYLPDPVDSWFGKVTKESDVLDLITEKVRQWENSVSGEIILPLSGGFDSRLLASMIADKSRLRCFTYGLSPNQSESFEVVNAKEIAQRLHLNWRQIELGGYHKYINDWYNLFGVSTHAHGMYHIEFYNKILKNYDGAMNFLSGIFGDVWAGNVKRRVIDSSSDIIKLGYTHGLNASSAYSLLPHDDTLLCGFYESNKEKLQYDFYQIITTIRLKIILISYLVTVPQSFGFSVFAPFLDMETALSMLCLPEERRRDRMWQKEYFEKSNLNLGKRRVSISYINTLHLYAMLQQKLPSLDHSYYDSYIQRDCIEEINTLFFSDSVESLYIQERSQDNKIRRTLHIKGILRRLGFLKDYHHKNFLEKYFAYLVLKPFELLFNRL
jgi:hypothetical protein